MPSEVLKIARGFSLPWNAVTEVISVLATRGAGKSFGSADIVEELYAAMLQFVVIDPMGVYWGLRSSYDGKKEGLKIIVLGGDQGDVPLEPTSGRLIADVVVDSGHSFVLDLSLFDSKAEQVRFMEAFLERIFYRKGPVENRTPLMIVVDEADEFAPQKPEKNETKMLSHMIRLAKRGRTRGIGLISLTQRSADFSKAVLALSSAVFFMRTADPRDRKAIKDWLAGQAPELIRLVDSEFPKLDTGHALVYSPHWLKLADPVKIVFRMIKTYDSYRTPEPGELRTAPKKVAQIDLAALGAEIAATVERAKENDPAELRKRIRELELAVKMAPNGDESSALQSGLRTYRDLVKRIEGELFGGWEDRQPDVIVAAVREAMDSPVEVPVFTDEDRKWLAHIGKALDGIPEQMRPISDKLGELVAKAAKHEGVPVTPAIKAVRELSRGSALAGRAAPRTPAPSPPPRPPAASNGHVPVPQQKILDALGWYEALGVSQPTRLQVGLISGYKQSGGFANLLGKLRNSEPPLIDYPAAGCVSLTHDGRALATDPGLPDTNEGVQAEVLARLPAPQAKLLRILIDHYPNAISRADLAEEAVYQQSGGFANLLGKLRSAALIDYPSNGMVIALDVLFPMG